MPLYTQGQVNLRDRAVSIAQTINGSGSVTRVVYTLDDGSTITDDLTYGPNSTTEPTSVTFGMLNIIQIGTITLSAFAINSTGTDLTYNTTGGTISALNGYITVAGVNINFSHTNNGSAALASPVSQNSVGITITITSATPSLVAYPAGVSTTNGSTVLVKQTLSWTGDVIVNGDVVDTALNAKTGYAGIILNSSKPFRVEGVLTLPPAGTVYPFIILDDDNGALGSWGTAQPIVLGMLLTSAEVYTTVNLGVGIPHGAPETAPGGVRYRLISTGNGTILAQTSSDNITFTTRRTVTGVSGNLYVKTFSNGANTRVEVRVYA